jgi:hypothetical protein
MLFESPPDTWRRPHYRCRITLDAPRRHRRRDSDLLVGILKQWAKHSNRVGRTRARPLEYASFEFSPHHGATVVVAWFHHVRRL